MAIERIDTSLEISTTKFRCCLGIRHLQYVLQLVAIVTVAGMRNILNVAVIAMISEDPPNENIPTYPEWASKKNIMLSSFFWGYVLFQVLAGEIAKKYGPRFLLAVTMFINSIFCLLLPYFGARFGYMGVIVCRVIQGVTQGPLLPCCHNLLSKWVHSQDRAKVGNFVFAGAPLGVVIAMPVAGAISSSSLGWPVVFYLYGGIGVLWSLLWVIFGSDSPLTDRYISVEEKKYIQSGTTIDEERTFPTPWKAIFTSAPFYAILISHCGQNWGYWTLLSETPSYMKKILNFNLASSSILSALPYLVQWLLGTVFSPIADLLISRNILSVGASRKLCNSIGTLIPGLALFTLNFIGSENTSLTLTILIAGVGMNAGVLCGFSINHMDISPVHCGTLMGITNSVSNIFSFIAPLAVDAIVQISGYQETEKELWDIVFSIAAIIFVVTGLMYVLLGSGEEQSWDKVEDRVSEVKKVEPLKKMSFIAQSL